MAVLIAVAGCCPPPLATPQMRRASARLGVGEGGLLLIFVRSFPTSNAITLATSRALNEAPVPQALGATFPLADADRPLAHYHNYFASRFDDVIGPTAISRHFVIL